MPNRARVCIYPVSSSRLSSFSSGVWMFLYFAIHCVLPLRFNLVSGFSLYFFLICFASPYFDWRFASFLVFFALFQFFCIICFSVCRVLGSASAIPSDFLLFFSCSTFIPSSALIPSVIVNCLLYPSEFLEITTEFHWIFCYSSSFYSFFLWNVLFFSLRPSTPGFL